MDKLILIGGGGHCKSCIDVIEAENKFEITGILDRKDKLGENINGYEIIGTDEAIVKLNEEKYSFFISVGQIKNPNIRTTIFTKLKKLNSKIPIVISPSAFVSNYASIGEGTIIMHSAIINSSATVGCNSIINNKALIEHDSTIGDCCHVSTGAIVNGGCEIGRNTFIGSGSVISNNINIISGTVIGAGSVVYNSIVEPGIYAGNPLRKI